MAPASSTKTIQPIWRPPRGEAAPARGWIKELQARQDGIWGRVEWTRLGERLVTGKAYRGLSPVIRHDASGNVIAILRASLVNQPNLRGLTALHQENSMSLLEKLIAALGLDAGATEDQVTEKVTSLHAQSGPAATSLQAAMAPIAKAVGLAENATSEAVLAGVAQLVEIKKAAGDLTAHPSVVALQAELTTVSTELKTLRGGNGENRRRDLRRHRHQGRPGRRQADAGGNTSQCTWPIPPRSRS